jgi:hypothetical protein
MLQRISLHTGTSAASLRQVQTLCSCIAGLLVRIAVDFLCHTEIPGFACAAPLGPATPPAFESMLICPPVTWLHHERSSSLQALLSRCVPTSYSSAHAHKASLHGCYGLRDSPAVNCVSAFLESVVVLLRSQRIRSDVRLTSLQPCLLPSVPLPVQLLKGARKTHKDTDNFLVTV